MKFAKSLIFAAAAMGAASMLGQAVGNTAPAKPIAEKKQPAHDTKTSAPHDPAEQAFQAHCSRCHYAPETLSPSLTGTVVRHMRTRAVLSAEEERLILSYFNP